MWCKALSLIFQNSVNWTLYVGGDYAKTLKIDSHNYDVLNAYGEFLIIIILKSTLANFYDHKPHLAFATENKNPLEIICTLLSGKFE